MATQRGEIPALSGARGLAAWLVILAHTPTPPELREGWLQKILEIGWVGVPIFFVLSGYLITWLGLREIALRGTLSLKDFYLRRSLRVFPLYFLAVTLALAAWPLPFIGRSPIASSPEWALPLITFTTNLALSAGYLPSLGCLVAFWTLALEEQFYIFWAPVLKWLTPKFAWLIALAVCAACLCYRLHPLSYEYFLAYRIQAPVSFLSIMLGCLLALGTQRTERVSRWVEIVLTAALVLLCLTLIVWETPFPTQANEACLLMAGGDVIGLILIFLCSQQQTAVAGFLARPLWTAFGRLSYCMYVVNTAVIVCLDKLVTHSFLVEIPAQLRIVLQSLAAAALIIALSLAWGKLERPLVALRYKFKRV